MNHTLTAVVVAVTLTGVCTPGGVATACAQPIPLSPTAQASGAVITIDQGIEFVTIGNQGGAGNAPFMGLPGVPGSAGSAAGRGRVDYEYRIGRF